MRYEVVEEISATLDVVWPVLADVERWPVWSATTTSVRLLEEGPFGLGSAAEIRQPKLPRNVWRVTAWEPNRRFEWVTRSPGVATIADHVLEALPGGRCRITLTAEITGFLAPLFVPLLGSMTRRYITQEASSLKVRCETSRSTS